MKKLVVRITTPYAWYYNKLGEEITVIECKNEKYKEYCFGTLYYYLLEDFYLSHGSRRIINKDNCEVVSEEYFMKKLNF